MASPRASAAEDPNALLERRKRLQNFSAFIAGAASFDEMLVGAQSHILEMFAADRCTIYQLDTKNRHLFSLAKTGGEFKEIRVGLDLSSIVGFVGVAKKALNIANVYEVSELRRYHPQLKFDDRWDVASGYTTRSVICVPVLYDNNLLGALQVLNRRDGQPFDQRDLLAAEEVAKLLAMAFFNLNRVKSLKQQRKASRWDGLIDAGAISEVDLAKAEGDAKAANVDLARWLVEKLAIARADVERSLSMFYNCEVFRFTGKETIPEELKKKVRVDYLKQIIAAPLERRGGSIVWVIDDPQDLNRLDVLRAIEPGLRTVVQVGLRDEIVAYIEQSYGLRGDVGLILKELSTEEQKEEGGAAVEVDSGGDESKVGEADSAVIKLANQVITDAYRRGASDIHVEPNGKERTTIVRFRVDGDCVAYQEIPPQYRMALVARFKIMANLDISERRKPQDGKIRFKMQDGRVIELRVATLPTVNGNEDVVMRILAASKPMPLDEMGMSVRNLAALKQLAVKPYGLILCVGPTGSGKTTTLHSVLGHINTPDMKIWTAEDPVEITQPGLRQVQVQPKIGFTFEHAMRAFLRADPDVIMVGEMRDRETAATGIEASLTGHLVLSTLHTNSAPETITRLLDMGLDPFSFADSLLGVLAQRLARSLCKRCREPYGPTAEEYAHLLGALGEQGLAERVHAPHIGGGQLALYRGRGCDNCGGTGYKGRIGLHELLVTDDGIKQAIARRAPVEEIRQLAMTGGMTTLLQDGVEKALMGTTDLKQVLAVCSR